MSENEDVALLGVAEKKGFIIAMREGTAQMSGKVRSRESGRLSRPAE